MSEYISATLRVTIREPVFNASMKRNPKCH